LWREINAPPGRWANAHLPLLCREPYEAGNSSAQAVESFTPPGPSPVPASPPGCPPSHSTAQTWSSSPPLVMTAAQPLHLAAQTARLAHTTARERSLFLTGPRPQPSGSPIRVRTWTPVHRAPATRFTRFLTRATSKSRVSATERATASRQGSTVASGAPQSGRNGHRPGPGGDGHETPSCWAVAHRHARRPRRRKFICRGPSHHGFFMQTRSGISSIANLHPPRVRPPPLCVPPAASRVPPGGSGRLPTESRSVVDSAHIIQ
jgi:hypothetical protein